MSTKKKRANSPSKDENKSKKNAKTEYSFPTEHLRTKSNSKARKCVLLLAGSFSPITFMHLRLMEQARDFLEKDGIYDVVGGYFSPVGDSYKKKGLASATHRNKMIEKSIESSDWLMLDKWESEQKEYQYTAVVIEHIHTEVQKHFKKEEIRVILACGSDLFSSLKKTDVWSDNDIHGLFKFGGIVVLERESSVDVMKIVDEHDLLYSYRKQIHYVRQNIINDTSSSTVRKLICRGYSVKYLIPDGVVEYIKDNDLYNDKALEKQVSIFGNY
eukprot:TRINITY_DN2775_c0_g1_i2.p1 TRINITY_DN2775_c0_g1~~TRINITY_DN2775_c0_g1_i2.p1  ORF type:complete len:272 (+),score=64.41 TRINITY_DN2775_c0_g1_i2:26-841(+)